MRLKLEPRELTIKTKFSQPTAWKAEKNNEKSGLNVDKLLNVGENATKMLFSSSVSQHNELWRQKYKVIFEAFTFGLNSSFLGLF